MCTSSNSLLRLFRDPLTMVKCVGIDEGEEPFTFSIKSNVLLVVDFHAHLCDSEIIGFLGGTWDPNSRGTSPAGRFYRE